MGEPVHRITIRGFKSIQALEEFDLRKLNVLVGANGAGKSNFVSFFSLLRAMIDQKLELTVEKDGGADRHLFLGPKTTKEIAAKLSFGANGYEFSLEPTVEGRFVFGSETVTFSGTFGPQRQWFGSGHREALLKDRSKETGAMGYESIAFHVYEALSSWVVYHFHDTSETAAVRRKWTTRDHEELRPDASNLAPVLLRIRDRMADRYQLIRDTVRLVAPFFDDFKLRPEPNGADTVVQLEWTQRGSDYPFHPSQLSDGTLRFICMTTALLQLRRPATMLFDEPELGLHPYALTVLGGLFKQAAARTQVIVSTQSAALVDHFEPEDVVVVGRKHAASTFRRLDRKELSEWLGEYSLGELWRKNVVEAGPIHE